MKIKEKLIGIILIAISKGEFNYVSNKGLNIKKQEFFCKECGAKCDENSKFCDNCGCELIWNCEKCGKPISINAKFCKNCGSEF